MTNQEEPSNAVEWDEAPVTLGLIGRIVEEHPNYNLTAHYDEDGRHYVMLQFPGDEEFDHDAAGEFVSMVSNL